MNRNESSHYGFLFKIYAANRTINPEEISSTLFQKYPG